MELPRGPEVPLAGGFNSSLSQLSAASVLFFADCPARNPNTTSLSCSGLEGDSLWVRRVEDLVFLSYSGVKCPWGPVLNFTLFEK